MDGNRRYAKQHGISNEQSYKLGAEIFRDSVEWCIDYGVLYYTVYAFSCENWKRPKNQVDTLMNLFEKFLNQLQELKDTDSDKKIKLIFIGRNIFFHILF